MSNQFAIIRINKLKANDLANAERHNLRLGEPEPNVDVSRSHLNRYIKSGKLGVKDAINARIKDAGITRKVRPDAVLGLEIVMTASPDFFDDAMREGKSEKLEDWIADSIAHLIELAGDEKNVVQIVLHMDEKTPHIQAIFVPLSDDAPTTAKKTKEKKTTLNAKPWTSPGKYQRMWTGYAAAMAKHGLRRGEFRLDNEPPQEHVTLKAGREEVIKTAQAAEAVAKRTENHVHESLAKQQATLVRQDAKIDLLVKQQGQVIEEQKTLLQSITAQLKQVHGQLKQAQELIKQLVGRTGSKGPQSTLQDPLQRDFGTTQPQAVKDVFGGDFDM